MLIEQIWASGLVSTRSTVHIRHKCLLPPNPAEFCIAKQDGGKCVYFLEEHDLLCTF